MIVKIIKTPEGPAPTGIRKAWVGVVLVAVPTSEDFVECDCLALARLAEEIEARMADEREISRAECEAFKEKEAAAYSKNRGGCMVPVDVALRMLEKQASAEAANWFWRNWPNKKGWFLFGPDEYVVLHEEGLN